MLTQYENETLQLLENPQASPSLYTTSDLDGWINRARQQIAGDGECVRAWVTLPVSAALGQQYDFSSIDLTNAPSGAGGVFSVRQAAYVVASGLLRVTLRPFAWFAQYSLMQPVPTAGPPSVAAQLGQGTSGSLFVNLLDGPYTMSLDCTCLPEPLADDTTPEAIPYPWTECVPFFAAFYALLSAQRASDADEMMKRYQQFRDRARTMSTSGVLPFIAPQTPDPTRAAQLGIRSGGA